MQSAIQLLVNGVAMGFIYCLIAIEYTLLFNTSGLINFGHDKYIMFGAYIFGGTFVLGFGIGGFAGVIGTILVMAALGVALGQVAFNPLRHLPTTYAITGCLALSLMLREIARLVYGAVSFTVPDFLSGVVKIGPAPITKASIAMIIVGILILVLQWLLMTKTKMGKALRAVSQDYKAAPLMGINVDRMMLLACGVSVAICGLIGALLIPLYGISLNMTTMIGSKGFVAGVVGGFGSLNGAIAGGLFVGIVEAIYSILGGPGIYKDIISFVLIVGFLMFRPQGILGKKGG
ncbi:branched-chain amino acid ABC transporter permease [Feifania hominis]|uniref:Branched-chain amino acid ABC transporter permease n=1 Tax=Feifania hominis TaxID=2763660 RepID=A0A926HTZ1_9FIRM|nr:branched-chain amino acid ABC transporter permease [Feifania hominis]MBC8536359.1 branched-chain amino acid ABC transporter permease [Feifania hominis]